MATGDFHLIEQIERESLRKKAEAFLAAYNSVAPTTVLPTGFVTDSPITVKSLPKLIKNVEDNLELSPDHRVFLKEGFDLQKNKKDSSLRIAYDTLIAVLEHSKPNVLDENSQALFQQNRKIIKELLTSVYNLIKQYEYDESRSKLVLLGKVLQYGYDSGS